MTTPNTNHSTVSFTDLFEAKTYAMAQTFTEPTYLVKVLIFEEMALAKIPVSDTFNYLFMTSVGQPVVTERSSRWLYRFNRSILPKLKTDIFCPRQNPFNVIHYSIPKNFRSSFYVPQLSYHLLLNPLDRFSLRVGHHRRYRCQL